MRDDLLRRTEQNRVRPGDYDYVIVGSGAGGGPLAANLARSGFTVCLLEAGGDSCAETELGKLLYEVPIFHGLSTEYPECQWDYFVDHYSDAARQALDSKLVTTDPATQKALEQAGVWYPRAGTLGGCTAHNAMITVTPQDVDWNYIADLTGDNSWRAERMNGYFARLENCHYRPRPGSFKYAAKGALWSMFALLRGRRDWRDWAHGHGFSGWLTTSEADPHDLLRDKALVKLVLNSVKLALKTGLGNPFLSFLTTLDPNDSRNGWDMREGLALTPLAVANGKRNGPREYLLRTRSETGNLTIQLRSLATKILFEGKAAVGIEFLEGKHLYEASPVGRKNGQPAERELDTPDLRQAGSHSGLRRVQQPTTAEAVRRGPKAELERFGIGVVADVPGVGENLQDRYEVGVVSEFEKPFVLLDKALFAPPGEGQTDPYFVQWQGGRGVYAGNGAVIGILKRSDPKRKEPDLYVFGLPGYFRGYAPGYSNQFERQRNRFTWAVLKAYTTNRAGRVSLTSPDATRWPRIEFKYFSEGGRPDIRSGRRGGRREFRSRDEQDAGRV